MTKNNCIPLWNEKYIGHKCIVCQSNIDDEGRQKLISLGVVQTWCFLCLVKKYPEDKALLDFANKKNDLVIDRNKFYKNRL